VLFWVVRVGLVFGLGHGAWFSFQMANEPRPMDKMTGVDPPVISCRYGCLWHPYFKNSDSTDPWAAAVTFMNFIL
jgi:hypothetical protein